MPAIRLLSETLVNRIAAGEVIERPAAAVKELVENALDAGSGRVSIALDDGGIARIEVVDDGCGMGRDDLELCVLRHATSKLNDENLVCIDTLGFRGEALPSIGSAARLELQSRVRGSEHGWRIRVEGGAVSAPEPCATPPGTRVVVRDLFYATPARRKFLKQPRTEADHAEQMVRRLALAAPHVAFRLEIDGNVRFDLPAADRAERIVALFGPDVEAVLLDVDAERGPLKLSGFICAPSLNRATAAAQSLVVNGRPVADPVLKTAVRVAYRDVITAHRHPVVALYLEIPATDLDVNVHPAKTELRFRDAAGVRALVIGALSRRLAAGATVAPPAEINFRPGLVGTLAENGPMGNFPSQEGPMQIEDIKPQPWRSGGMRTGPMPRYTGFAATQLPIQAPPSARTENAPPSPLPEHPLGAPVAQVLDTYIIAVAADGNLVLVDQHAAHERLMHEVFREQIMGGQVRSQPLLLPAVVELPQADAQNLLAREDQLARLGLEIEAFGPGAVLVRALPAVLGTPAPAALLRDIADELAEMDETTSLESRLDQVVARMACHGSIRAGRRLNIAEMSALLRQMEATPRAATCSHGRPTFLKLSRNEIERLFGRR